MSTHKARRTSLRRSFRPAVEGLEVRLAPAVTSAGWFEQLAPRSNAVMARSATQDLTRQIPWNGRTVSARADEWIVQLSPSALTRATSVGAAAALLSRQGLPGSVLHGLGAEGQLLVTTAGVSQMAAESWLRTNPMIAYYEPNLIVTVSQIPNDPSFPSLYGLHNTGQTGGTMDADIDAPEAWDITTGSSNDVVAVFDTGIDWTHPDLAANVWTNPGEIGGDGIDNDRNGFIDDIRGWDFVQDDNNPMDTDGHGTHVSGTIGALGNNAVGVAGVNWNVKILPLRIFNPFAGIDDVVRGLRYVVAKGVKVSNHSWGGGSYSVTLFNAIQEAGTNGHLFVAAAGNGGLDWIGDDNDRFPDYPASYNLDNIISVAATDKNDRLASFSNYGATSVDLAAPGVNIYSTVPGNDYDYGSGTSMAAPHVSGVAALAWAAKPNATMAEVRNAILAGVDPISSLSGKVATGGRLNAHNTLARLSEFRINTTVPRQQTLGRVALRDNGDFVAVWQGQAADGTWDIYAKLYDAQGNVRKDEFRVNQTVAGDQFQPDVGMDATGNFVVAWTGAGDGDDVGAFVRRFDANGNPLTNEIRVNRDPSYQNYANSVAVRPTGEFVVSFDTLYPNDNLWDGYFQMFNAAGEHLGGPVQVHDDRYHNQVGTLVAVNANGDLVAAWSAVNGSTGWDVRGRRFNAQGQKLGVEFDVPSALGGSQFLGGSLGIDRNGNFAVPFESRPVAGQDGSGMGIYVQRFDANGKRLSTQQVLVNTTVAGDQRGPYLAMNPSGAFVIGWTSMDQDGSAEGAYFQRYDANGQRVGREAQLNVTTAGSQIMRSAAIDAVGNAILVWQGNGPGDDVGVFARRFVAPASPSGAGGSGGLGAMSLPKFGGEAVSLAFPKTTALSTPARTESSRLARVIDEVIMAAVVQEKPKTRDVVANPRRAKVRAAPSPILEVIDRLFAESRS